MPDDPEHRAFHTRNPDAVTFRQDDEQQWMDIRLPIASTGEVRNEGDEPLTRAELVGMAEQINTGRIGVFPEHGQSDLIDFTGYSQFEKLGYWTDAEVEGEAAADGSDILYATARVLDPEPLPSQTGRFREALSILREQAAAGVPITTSIGWRADEDAPGGNDLLEVSIAGLQADPRTGTEGGEALIARAVAASTERFDLASFVRTLRDSGMRPLGPPEDPERFDTFEECVDALAEDPDLSREDAEEICGAWEAAKDDQSTDHDMTDEDTETEPDEEQATEQREDDEKDDDEEETMSAEEFRAEMLGLQRQQMDTLQTLAEAVREDDDEDDEEEEQADDEDEDEDDDEMQAADGDDTDERDLQAEVDALREELDAVRSGETDIETPDEGDDAERRDADDGEPESEQRTTDDADPADKPTWAR